MSKRKETDKKLKVLAFTASANRPVYLRHCILQMQNQTYPIDHGVYVNSKDYHGFEDSHNYLTLVDDILIRSQNKLLLSYGPTASHHLNHMAAVKLFDWQQYDLFFKIDDDDVYRSTYVEEVINDYFEQQWDFSGAISKGHIKDSKWFPNHHLQHYVSDYDKEHQKGFFMPPTFVWNKKCMGVIINIETIKGAEDSVWKECLLTTKGINVKTRVHSNFVYNIHKDTIKYRAAT